MSTLLTEAQLIVENRAADYGDTRENMQATADLWNAYFKSISVKRSHVTKSNLENFLTEEDIPQIETNKSNPTPKQNGLRPKYKTPDGWDTGKGSHGSFHKDGREKGHTNYEKKPDKWDGMTREAQMSMGANKRSVWTVATQPFSEAHFATFPPKLIVPCIKAGCPEGGIVLDPFFGAGTTGLVAKKLGRDFIGIELNAEYIEIAQRRIAEIHPTFFDKVSA